VISPLSAEWSRFQHTDASGRAPPLAAPRSPPSRRRRWHWCDRQWNSPPPAWPASRSRMRPPVISKLPAPPRLSRRLHIRVTQTTRRCDASASGKVSAVGPSHREELAPGRRRERRGGAGHFEITGGRIRERDAGPKPAVASSTAITPMATADVIEKVRSSSGQRGALPEHPCAGIGTHSADTAEISSAFLD